MMINADDEITYYVMFRNSTRSHWLTRLLKRGFGHCYYIVGSGHGSIVVDHKMSRITTVYIDKHPEQLARMQLGYLDTRAVKFTHKPVDRMTYRTIMNCVSLTINGIGLQRVLAITPYDLYCKLLKLGGEEL